MEEFEARERAESDTGQNTINEMREVKEQYLQLYCDVPF